MNHPAQLDEFALHLARVLTTTDLSARLVERPALRVTGDLLGLVRTLVGAARVSLFRVDGLEGDGTGDLSVVRIGRSTAEETSEASVAFDERASSLLLSCLWSGASEAIGPIGPADPFRARHLAVEADASSHALFVPIAPAATPLGVLEVTRDGAPFSPAEIGSVEAAARVAAPAIFLREREDTVADLLLSLLPPDVLRTPLRDRVRAFLVARRASPEERRALVVAASISDLRHRSSRSLALAEDVLEAIHRSLSTEGK